MKKTKEDKFDVDFFRLIKAFESKFELTTEKLEGVERICDTDEVKVFYDVKRDWSYPVGMSLN